MARQNPRYRGPEEGKDAKRAYNIEACTAKMDAMSQECLMSGCQRKFSMENCKKESIHKVAKKKNATKTPLKPHLWISIFQLSPGNRLLRIEQSGVASSTKVPPNLKKREPVKLKGSVKKGKQEPKNHHQSQQSEFTCSICNRQFRAKIGLYVQPSTNTQTHINASYSGIKMVFLINERRTIILIRNADQF